MSEFGLSQKKIREVSKIKAEPKWMLDFRITAYKKFLELNNPTFGPELKIDFNEINYYKKVVDNISNDWDNLPENISKTFDQIGLIDAEKKYLDGVKAQYESEVIYHSMLEELKEKKVIFCDTDSALKLYPELFQEYFNNLVKYDENKYTALNGAIWSGGTFIYIPPNTTIERPLQSYFRINTKTWGNLKEQ